jgi:hypothetical protein
MMGNMINVEKRTFIDEYIILLTSRSKIMLFLMFFSVWASFCGPLGAGAFMRCGGNGSVVLEKSSSGVA